MIERDELVHYLDQLLAVDNFQDYCPNGLQVEGAGEISRIIGGVTASQALIDAAVAERADAILVHHGYFWRNEAAPLVGMKYRRIKALMDAGINLLAYHLPLDAHGVYGNNVQLARVLEINIDAAANNGLVHRGELSQGYSLDDFAQHVEQRLQRKPLVIDGGGHEVKRVAWCTGAAQSAIEEAAAMGVDLYISGEISEATVHQARELGIHYLAAGHHATERYGIESLGQHLIEKYQIEFKFLDIDNPA